jgi:hypothetical protein
VLAVGTRFCYLGGGESDGSTAPQRRCPGLSLVSLYAPLRRPVLRAEDPSLVAQKNLLTHLLRRGADGEDAVDGLLGRANPRVGVVLVGVHGDEALRDEVDSVGLRRHGPHDGEDVLWDNLLFHEAPERLLDGRERARGGRPGEVEEVLRDLDARRGDEDLHKRAQDLVLEMMPSLDHTSDSARFISRPHDRTGIGCPWL